MKSDIEPFGPYALVLAQCEINMLQAALDQYSGDAEAAASSLRISEQFFRTRAQVLGVPVGSATEPTLPETPVAKAQAVPPAIAQIRQERRLIAAAAIHGKAPPPATVAPTMTLEDREALAAALIDDEDDDEDDDDEE